MQSNPRIVNLLVILVILVNASNISQFTSKTDQKEPQVKGGHGAWAPGFVLNRNGPYVEELLVDYWWDMEGL